MQASPEEQIRRMKRELGIDSGMDAFQRRYLELQAIFKYGVDGMFILRDTRIEAANDAFCAFVNRTASEINGQNLSTFLDTDHPNLKSALPERGSNRSFFGELDFRLPDGTLAAAEVTIVPITVTPEETFSCFFVHPLSNRRKLQNENERRGAMLGMLLENTNESLILLDRNLKIVELNKAAQQTYYPLLRKSLTIGDSALKLIPELEQESYRAMYHEVLCGLKHDKIREFQQVDGSFLALHTVYTPLLNYQGQVDGIFLSIRDISSTRQVTYELEKQQALFSALVQQAPDGMVIIEVDGSIRFANASCTALLGYDLQARLGASFFDFVWLSDVNQARELLTQVLAQPAGINRSELRMRGKENEAMWCEFRIQNQLTNPLINGIVLHFNDISDRRAAQNALAESRYSLEQLLNHTGESFMLFNRKYQLVAFNHVANDLHQQYHGEPLQVGQKITASLVVISRTEAEQILRRIVKGEVVDITQSIPAGSADERFFRFVFRPVREGDGSISGGVVIGEDVTEGKKAEAAIADSRERLLQAQAIARIGSWDYNVASGLLLWSPQTYEVMNLAADAPPSWDLFFSNIHPADREMVKSRFQEVTGGTTTFIQVEHRLVGQFGEERWVRQIGTKRESDNARGGWFNGTCQDISLEKRAIAAQEKLVEETKRQNRSLEQLTFIASHSLRAPVANISSLMNFLNREKLDDPMNAEIIEMIETSAGVMDAKLQDLLEVLRMRGDVHAPADAVSFADVLKKVRFDFAGPLVAYEATVVSKLKVTSIYYPKHQLEGIFAQFISNALKFRHLERMPEIVINSDLVDDFIVLSFSDNGLGIDLERYRNRVFGMYQVFHKVEGAKGLGLYLINEQVQSLGGRIEVSSQMDIGTTFTVYLKNQADARSHN